MPANSQRINVSPPRRLGAFLATSNIRSSVLQWCALTLRVRPHSSAADCLLCPLQPDLEALVRSWCQSMQKLGMHLWHMQLCAIVLHLAMMAGNNANGKQYVFWHGGQPGTPA